jgi:hypothetical protein
MTLAREFGRGIHNYRRLVDMEIINAEPKEA